MNSYTRIFKIFMEGPSVNLRGIFWRTGLGARLYTHVLQDFIEHPMQLLHYSESHTIDFFDQLQYFFYSFFFYKSYIFFIEPQPK